jgi:hypothetical protein
MKTNKPRLISINGTTVPQPACSEIVETGCPADPMRLADGLQLIKAFQRISDPARRRKVIKFAEKVAKNSNRRPNQL